MSFSEILGDSENDRRINEIQDAVASATADLRRELEQCRAENQQLKHCEEEWDLALSEYSDYEGDEAPWNTMRNEFEKLKAELAALRNPKEK